MSRNIIDLIPTDWPEEGKKLLHDALNKAPEKRTLEESRAFMYFMEGRLYVPASEVWQRPQGSPSIHRP
jgi:hypothetical protein